MKQFWAAVCAAMTAISGASAQSPSVANPNTILESFEVQALGAVLSELGAVWQASQGADGAPFIAANAGGEVVFFLQPTACRGANHTNCIGLSMVALFTGAADPQTVSAFNYRYAFASAGIDPAGNAYINRYEIADYGLPRGNLAMSILVFVEQIKMLRKELSLTGRTVSLEGEEEELTSAILNSIEAERLAGGDHLRAASVDDHQQALAESAQSVRRFIADDMLPRNKIDNLIQN